MKNAVLECSKCKATFSGGLKQRKTSTANVTEWGFTCPNCGAYFRTHYENTELSGLRFRVRSAQSIYQRNQNESNWNRYIEARERFRKAFDALQKEMTGHVA